MNAYRLCAVFAAVAFIAVRAGADEASGKVTELGFGSFKLDEKGTLRQFNLTRDKTTYDPSSWRPAPGDEVALVFAVTTGRKGQVLAVSQVKLTKAGPETVQDLSSPAVVEVTEVGRIAIKAKTSSGKSVRFSIGKETQRVPAGWVPSPGEKASIEFKVEKAKVGFGVVYTILKMEKTK